MPKRDLVAVDLFCGVGGLTHGMEKAGIRVVAGIDNDATCKFAYEANNKARFVEKDITKLKGTQLKELYPKDAIKVLVGCCPCQTFSQHTIKNEINRKDTRWGLLYHFLRLIRSTNPDVISMENVPRLRNYPIFKKFIAGLKSKGYKVYFRLVNCPRYGIPQRRVRLVLLAAKEEIKLMPETHNPDQYVSIRAIIGDLQNIGDGDIDKNDIVHKAWALSPINKRRIKQSKQGGSWLDWDEELRLECHKRKGGATYKAVYGRMRWDQVAPTITTQFYSYGTGRFGHPEQDRAISLREGALLQTFEPSYKFIPHNPKDEELSFDRIGRHIGNAVPVRLGEVIGTSILNYVKEVANG